MRLNDSEYATLIESSPGLIRRSDAQGRCDYVNRTWVGFTGRPAELELGEGWLEIVHPDDRALVTKAFSQAGRDKGDFAVEYRIKRRDGEWRWMCDTRATVDVGGSAAGYIDICIDITDRVEAERLKETALTDGLTGLYRSRYFEERLNDEVGRAKRYKYPLAIIKSDIDDFRALNDDYGRGAGDKVLKALAAIVKENTRAHDIAGRIGGDEFCIALPHVTAEAAEVAAERIRALARDAAISFDRRDIRLKCWVAVAALADETDASALLHKADRKLYDAKKAAGRGREVA